MNKNHFFANNVVFQTRESHFTEKEIIDIIPYAFEGKEYFVQFYLTYDGIWFPDSAYLYRDLFYKVSDEDNMLAIDHFLFLTNAETTVISIWDAIKENKGIKKEYSDNHIPFACDAGGNLFLIELKSGKIKYMEMESPYDVTLVAPSFIDFCNGIQAEER
jgi:hypothetical protein